MSIQVIDVQEATCLKDKANQFFHKQEYEEAVKLYYEAMKFCSIVSFDESEQLVTTEDEPTPVQSDEVQEEQQQQQESTTMKNEEDEKLTAVAEDSPEDKACKELEVILRSNLAACFVKMGAYNRAVSECNIALKIDPKHNKALYRRTQAHEALDQLEESFNDIKLLHELNPESAAITAEHERIQKKLEAKRKEEMDKMLGQLKDLGNSLLGKFGLSLDNFKMQQDPQTGSYSLNMNNSNR